MHLILWRHAEAADTLPDLKRELTRKGQRQARTIAAWLTPRLPANTRVITSPAQRAMQTASALTQRATVVDVIAPGAPARALLAAAGWPDARQPVVLVGHQPALGEAAAILLAGEELPWSIKKAGLWWFVSRQRNDETQIVLRAVMSPEMLD